MPVLAGRATFQAELGALPLQEKAHTRERDAIAAAADGCQWRGWTPPGRPVSGPAGVYLQ
jgi:hypothetical protein